MYGRLHHLPYSNIKPFVVTLPRFFLSLATPSCDILYSSVSLWFLIVMKLFLVLLLRGLVWCPNPRSKLHAPILKTSNDFWIFRFNRSGEIVYQRNILGFFLVSHKNYTQMRGCVRWKIFDNKELQIMKKIYFKLKRMPLV